jgi:hypothetical protein
MTVSGVGYFIQVLRDYASHSLMVNIIPEETGMGDELDFVLKVASPGPRFEVG